jgi:glycosyltransferase involved in cell wall biosynthesis
MNKESLSIVFSTRKNNPEFIDHLKQTCGVIDVEILQYLNNGERSLTEIYNKGFKEAKNNIVVFSHDDIIFEQSSKWGRKIINHFQHSDYGILGKAGTTSLTETGRWWDQPYLMVGHVWHQQTEQGKTVTWENQYSGNFGDKIIETILVDGLFFAIYRKRIKKFFDENIKGFHFYDIDFSFSNHLEGVKVGVIFDMKITHKSIGITNKEWEANRIVFVNKWKRYLPYNIKPQILYEDMNITIEKQPKVSIIIPTKDRLDLLCRCINSILEKTRYRNYTIYIVDKGSDNETVDKMRDYIKQKDNVILKQYTSYNLPRILNDVVRNLIDTDTELLLFCHDDIKLLNDALSRCVQIYLNNKEDIGTMGIRLHFDDNSIQHAGILLVIDQYHQLGITNIGMKSYYSYYPGIERDTLGNTSAFMMVSRALFLSLGGFPEYYEECFTDVEFNLKSIIAGRVNYFAGDAVAYHYEPLLRSDNPEKLAKQNEDLQRLRAFIFQHVHDSKIIQYIRFAPLAI